MKQILCSVAILVLWAMSCFGATKNEGKVLDEAAVLKSIKGPAGCDLSVFALPPQVMYPTALAATPAGELYVAIDEDGSLGKEAGKGRVVKCVDTDGDGKADRFTVFAKMEHPRGIYFDSATDTLIVLHPPFITAFHDDNHDGVADRSEVLATGIANEKIQQQRGADHTTNGFRLGIDGWIYFAQGDFGSPKAVGVKDRSTYTRHGGGVSRIRVDGTGLEIYSTGQRNICDVAVDPLLNVFTRDNTNDGDGWDVRLSYIVPSGYYGYPSRFKHFKDEFIEPLADYGGGSPVGALFLDEPGFPGDFGHGLYTCEWGNGAIFRHPLEALGAGYKGKTRQEEFMRVPRAIDMDADACGHLYVASWMNGGFSYTGPNVGYVVRATPKNHQAVSFPDLKKVSDDQLVGLIGSASGVTRQYAQREILVRGGKDDPSRFELGLQALASSRETLAVRVAALFTLTQLEPGRSNEFIASLVKDEDLREFALRALCDRKNDANVPAGPFLQGLSDANPRVRLMAAWGLGRLGKRDAAGQMMALVGDADPLVAHVAINALVSLDAGAAALKAIDAATPKLAPGAVRVLQELHETQIVDGLVERLKSIQDPAIRGLVYRGLCRLYFREADWTGDWWGTRPDTSGPYFKTAQWEGTGRVESALKAGLATERPEVLKELVVQMQKNKVDLPELSAALRRIVEQDPSFKGVLIELAAERQNLGADQVAMLGSVVADGRETTELRVKALRVLQKNARGPETLTAAIGAIASLPAPAADKALGDAVNEFLRDSRLAQQLGTLSKIAESDSGDRRDVVFSILVNLSSNKLLQKDQRAQQSLGRALDRVWGSPAQTVALLATIGRMRAVEFEPKVKSLTADKNATVATAAKATLAKMSASSTPATNVAAALLIEKMPYEQVVAAAIKEKGDAALGKELFTKQGCMQCHTTSAQEPPKGPFLGGIAKRYNRAELCESILKPSAKISQGFETQWFKDADGEMYEGFVTRDAGDEIELRNILGVTTTLKKSEITERGKREISVMPEGLVAKLTVHDLGSILAYLESLGG